MYRFYDDGRIEGLGEGWATMFNDTVILEKMIAYHRDQQQKTTAMNKPQGVEQK